jgi:hypothetical protein
MEKGVLWAQIASWHHVIHFNSYKMTIIRAQFHKNLKPYSIIETEYLLRLKIYFLFQFHTLLFHLLLISFGFAPYHKCLMHSMCMALHSAATSTGENQAQVYFCCLKFVAAWAHLFSPSGYFQSRFYRGLTLNAWHSTESQSKGCY